MKTSSRRFMVRDPIVRVRLGDDLFITADGRILQCRDFFFFLEKSSETSNNRIGLPRRDGGYDSCPSAASDHVSTSFGRNKKPRTRKRTSNILWSTVLLCIGGRPLLIKENYMMWTFIRVDVIKRFWVWWLGTRETTSIVSGIWLKDMFFYCFGSIWKKTDWTRAEILMKQRVIVTGFTTIWFRWIRFSTISKE